MPDYSFDQRSLQSVFGPLVAGADPRTQQFYQMMEYHLGWRDEQLQPEEASSGKLIRPRLCLLACGAAGGSLDAALPVAAAIQIVHDFSLVHDDIQDRSDLRRGRPTVWRLWGEAQGINVGDALFTLAHLALFAAAERGLPADRLMMVARHFDATILSICEGQYLDLSFEDRLDLDENDYLAMIERKTATLIACSLELGAMVGGASAGVVSDLGAYGRALGMSFQIQDDVIGIWGDPEVTGKPFAADLYRRKKSLPVVYALAHAAEDDRLLLRSLYAQAEIGEDEVGSILAILDRAGARRYAEEQAERHHRLALSALDRLSGCDAGALAELRALAESLLGRAA